MSLSGLIIKISIVLFDEVNLNLERGESRYDALVNAGPSRSRSVVLTAATTVEVSSQRRLGCRRKPNARGVQSGSSGRRCRSVVGAVLGWVG